MQAPTENGKIDPLALNNTNKLEIRVFGNDEFRQAVVIARLDNLGKGASGAAVQNLKLMLGLGDVNRPIGRCVWSGYACRLAA